MITSHSDFDASTMAMNTELNKYEDLEERVTLLEDNIDGWINGLKEGVVKVVGEIQTKIRKIEEQMASNAEKQLDENVIDLNEPEINDYPVKLTDVKDEEVRSKIAPYYKDHLPTPEKLTPVQRGYMEYFFKEKKAGEFNGTNKIVRELITDGIKDGMWTKDFCPDGLKNQNFGLYLKEKIRNLSKRKAQEDANEDFMKKCVDTALLDY